MQYSHGGNWFAISFNKTLLHVADAETGKRLDLRGNGMGIQIIFPTPLPLAVLENEMSIETYSTFSSFESLVTIMEGWSVFGMSTGVDGNTAVITITEIDDVSKICSGTFSFKTSDFDHQRNQLRSCGWCIYQLGLRGYLKKRIWFPEFLTCIFTSHFFEESTISPTRANPVLARFLQTHFSLITFGVSGHKKTRTRLNHDRALKHVWFKPVNS